MRNLIIILLLIFGGHIQLNAQFNRLPASEEQYVDDKLQDALSTLGIRGVAAGIVVDGEIAYIKGAGFSDVANGFDVNECTLFRTASICKPLSEILARILDTEMPNFSVNDPVVQWLPSFSLAQNNPGMTVLDLMNHTSGIDNYGAGWDGNAADNYYLNNVIFDAQKALDIVDQCVVYTPAQWPMGATSLYSTANYMILGAVLEKVTGRSFQELMKTRYTDPLNMHNYQPEYQWMSYTNKCKGYNTSGNLIALDDISYKLPGGGFLTTAADMALFMKAYTNDVIPDDNGGTTLSHTGSQPGTYTYFRCSKSVDRGAVLLSNTDLSSASVTIFRALLDDIYDEMNGLTSADLTGNAYSEAQTTFSLAHMTGTVLNGQSRVYAASSVTSGTFEAQNGSDVRTLSDSKVTLSPGFKVREGSYFVAAIENVRGGCPVQPKSLLSLNNEPIEEQSIQAQQIYPNPTDGDLSIEYGENVDQIIILDLSGKLLIQLEANENGYDRLDLKDFTAGMYFVQFLSGSELIENKKLIIRN